MDERNNVLTYDGLVTYHGKIKKYIGDKDDKVKDDLNVTINHIDNKVSGNTVSIDNHETRITNLEVYGGDEAIDIETIDDICR